MFAVIKTGGKQYRVKPGDVLVVEKLDGEPGAEVRFDQVLMMGEGDDITVGAPLVDGGLVTATLVETRKGEKVKIFKKIRRQGYRRTGGHRQPETVLRVTGLSLGGRDAKWDGQVDLTPRSELLLRARGLASRAGAALTGRSGDVTPAAVHADSVVTDSTPGPVHHVTVVEHGDPVAETAPKKTAAKKTAAKKTASPEAGALVEPPTSEVAADQPQTVKAKTPKTGAQAGSETAPKKTAAKKTAAKKTADDGEA
jgi:large subunit ribosomal protein L21